MIVPNLNSTTAAELMTSEVVTASPTTPVRELAKLLVSRGFGGVPVVSESGELVGMVSGFDVISKTGQVTGEIMSRGVVSVSEDADFQRIAGMMGLHGIRRIPVCRERVLVGIISRSDLLRHWVSATGATNSPDSET